MSNKKLPPDDDGVEVPDDELEAEALAETPETERPPMTAKRPKNRGVAAMALAGIARGFQHVFEPKKTEKAAIVQEADDPERSDDGTYSVKLNADRPQDTVIRFHPPEVEGDNEGDADTEKSDPSDDEKPETGDPPKENTQPPQAKSDKKKKFTPRGLNSSNHSPTKWI